MKIKSWLLPVLFLITSPFFSINSFASIEIYSHRGLRWLMPENTLEAVKLGLAHNPDWIDVDIVLSRDNEIIVGHDLVLSPNLVRDNKGFFLDTFINSNQSPSNIQTQLKVEFEKEFAVLNLNYSQLLTFDVGSLNLSHSYSNFFPEQLRLDGVRMPKLEDIIKVLKLNRVAGKPIKLQIEMKTEPGRPDISPEPAKFAKILYDLLKKENILEETEIQAFDFRCLIELQKLDPNIKTAYLTSRDNEPGGIDSFYNENETKAGQWTNGVLIKDHQNSIPKMIKALGGYAWEPEDAQLTAESLAEAHSYGLKVVVWTWPEKQGTAFDFNLTKKMISLGVDGIITDDPMRLQKLINSLMKKTLTNSKLSCNSVLSQD